MKFRKDVAEASGGGHYIKLKDKESVTGIFMGEPHEFAIVWENGKSRHVPTGTPGSKFRFNINFVVKEGTTYVPKIYEGGPQIYNQMADINEEYPLEETPVKITRNGTGLDTEYNLMPMLKNPLTKEIKDYLATITLHKLGESEPPRMDANEQVPF